MPLNDLAKNSSLSICLRDPRITGFWISPSILTVWKMESSSHKHRGAKIQRQPQNTWSTRRQKWVRMKPVGSLAVVLAVVLVVLCFRRQLQLTLTALLQKPIGLDYRRQTNKTVTFIQIEIYTPDYLHHIFYVWFLISLVIWEDQCQPHVCSHWS